MEIKDESGENVVDVERDCIMWGSTPKGKTTVDEIRG